jgi:hypothetical protein
MLDRIQPVFLKHKNFPAFFFASNKYKLLAKHLKNKKKNLEFTHYRLVLLLPPYLQIFLQSTHHRGFQRAN